MKGPILKFDQLTDSKEILHGREPDFIILFIAIILFLFITAFIWLWFARVDMIIKATGIVRPLRNISGIYNHYQGEIEQINYTQGQKIARGELLYSIKSTTLKLEKNHLLKEIEKLRGEISALEKLKKSIEDNKNILSESNIVYYNRFLAFKMKYSQLILDCNRAENRYRREESLTAKFTTDSKLEKLETDYKFADLSRIRYKTETIVSIIKEIDNKSDKLEQLLQQLNTTNQKITTTNMRAPISGTVQICQYFNEGDYMPAGIEVLRIIPDSNSRLKMQITVKNKDISQLETGQVIKYRFLSLPYREYGILKGRIKKIGSDILRKKDKSSSPYVIEASIAGNELFDEKGNAEFIKVGMLAEARIVGRKRKLLYLVLEKLDF